MLLFFFLFPFSKRLLSTVKIESQIHLTHSKVHDSPTSQDAVSVDARLQKCIAILGTSISNVRTMADWKATSFILNKAQK